MKERILYKETYNPHAASVKAEFLAKTRLPHVPDVMELKRIEPRAAGTLTLDGVEYEFQDLRVYFQEKK